MTRDMRVANSTIFQRLASFANDRENPIPNPNALRWISSDDLSKDRLKRAEIINFVSFGRFRHLASLEYDGGHYVGSIGFDYEMNTPDLVPVDDIRGFDVCLLSELPVLPNVTGIEVYDVVAAGSQDDGSGYIGHDCSLVKGLFPYIRMYRATGPIKDDLVWPIFLNFSAKESRFSGSWIDESLASALLDISSSDIESFPYKELCRSTLDLDPRSLFMSLYRCIEATYAHHQSSLLKTALKIGENWQRVAAELEHVMSWRPVEEVSLKTVLKHANHEDLRKICECLEISIDERSNLPNATGKAIYKLRNRIVHFRPAHDPVELEGIDWNQLCSALASIASKVFPVVYGHEGDNDEAA